jgi:membrane glycosyltransferase
VALDSMFTLILRSDTDDPEQATSEAIDFVRFCKETMGSKVRIASMILLERKDQEGDEE